jgi:hypothetical protein
MLGTPMKSIFRLLVLVLLLTGWGLAALSLHVVRAQGNKIVLIPKQKLHVTDTYVDARTWNLDEAVRHPALLKRIIESGKADLFAYLLEERDRDDPADALEDALRDRPRETERSNGNSSSGAKAAGAWWNLGR